MSRSQARWLLVVAGVLLWFLAVVPAYYAVHKPLAAGDNVPAAQRPSPNVTEVAAAALSLAADLSLLALSLVVTAAWGNRLGRWLGLTFDSDLERWGLAATLGLGLLGTVVLGMSAVQGLYRWVGYAVLVALGVTAWPELGALLRWLGSGLGRLRRIGSVWWLLYPGAMGVLSLGLALLPPTGWDALVYHLQGPRLYLESHRLVGVTDNFYLNWPAQMEMLFTWGLLLKGDTLAKLFHWVFWLLTAVLLYVLARRTEDRGMGRWTVTLWAAVPLATELAGVAYVDLGLTAFVLAAVYAFMRWTEAHKDGWLALSALFAGLGLATKYTAATWVAALILLAAYHALRHQTRSPGWVALRCAGFAAVAGLVAGPWLVKNWIVTGNPIYPFLFGGEGWNPTREAWLTWPGQGYSRNPLDYLALPWLMTVVGTSGTAAFDATIGPLLLFLAPLVFMVRGRPRAVNYGLALVGVQLAYFVITAHRYVYLVETRLLLPAFPLLCLAAAYALRRLPDWDRQSFRLSRVIGGMVILVLVTNLVTEGWASLEVQPLAPLLGLESREAYLSRRLGAHYEAMQCLDHELGEATGTLFLWEPRSYYAQGSTRADATLDNLAQMRVATAGEDDPAGATLLALRTRGFSHILLHRAGLEFLQGPTPRPPTLGSLLGNPDPAESYYPLTEDDVQFLKALLAQSQPAASLGGHYEIYAIP